MKSSRYFCFSLSPDHSNKKSLNFSSGTIICTCGLATFILYISITPGPPSNLFSAKNSPSRGYTLLIIIIKEIALKYGQVVPTHIVFSVYFNRYFPSSFFISKLIFSNSISLTSIPRATSALLRLSSHSGSLSTMLLL